MKIEIQPVILCGSSSNLLWPLSRSGFPKYFLCLAGNESLFQQMARRFTAVSIEDIVVSKVCIVTGEEQRFLALEQLRETGVPVGATLLEPISRNTAPALTLAALAALERGTDPVLFFTPADHSIADQDVFIRNIQEAARFAAAGNIVTFGICSDQPESKYNYIQIESSVNNQKNFSLVVQRFVEKPYQAAAQSYLDEGGYCSSLGMFVVKASVWMAALGLFRPDIAQATHKAWEKRATESGVTIPVIRPGKSEFIAIPAVSIDYAVIKHCPGSNFDLKMVPLAAGWSSFDNWDTVWQALPKDEFGNVSQGDILTTDSSNTLVHATNRLVALVGIDNLVVIETPDVVLVADRSRSEGVKAIIKQLQNKGREEGILHRKVLRPWGWYDSIDEAEGFKVKRIQVKPKASLSLQKHYHRAEHWIVIKGKAEITIGDKTFQLIENQSTYIPLGQVHRLANPGAIPLEIIEVQLGNYLGEDDIVRFEDAYGRVN